MQRVFRSSLVGLLTIAGLAACGDKVTVPPVQTTPPDLVVHSVVVTPSPVAISVGGSVILAAAVDAGSGVTVRTVTWTSSDATVASVDATGKVTGVKVGTVTITAAATADPNVKGAAVVTVGSVVSTAPTVTIQSVNNTICGLAGCTSTPVPVQGAAGQLDIILNVDTPVGQVLRSVQATLKCGNHSLTRVQTVGDVAPAAQAAEEAASPVTISINTADFNATTGVPTLHNNPACTISASATTASGVQSATNSQTIALNNADAVVVNSAFAGGQSGADGNGITWRSGSLTVSVLPILYSGRTLATMTVSLPNAQGLSKSLNLPAVATGATTASFPNATSGGTSSARIGQVTLTGCAAPGCSILDPNGFPVPITPVVLAIDSNGNDVNLVSTGSATSFRLDNQSPAAPSIAQIPTRQNGWVNAAYVFAGVGPNNGATAVNYYSGGDVGTAGTVGVGGPTPAGNSNSGLPAGTTTTYFYKLASAYVPAVDGLVDGNGNIIGTAAGNAGSAGQCVTTGFTQIATANDLPPTSTNLVYVVRIFETDKLGNFRCTDLGSNVGTTAFVQQKFGVDKVAPVAVYVEPAAGNNAAGDKMVVSGATGANPIATPAFMIGLSDDASGFNSTPLSATLVRLAIDPSTGVASVPNSTFGCVAPSALNGSGVCTAGNASTTTPADGGSGIDGYYTYSATARDQARNSTTVPARTVVIDHAAPTMGSIAVPATVNPGTSTGGVFLPASPSAQFSTSATDNLDLINYDYTVTYPNPPSGTVGNFAIRSPATTSSQVLGVAFDNVLTTASAFSLNVPAFIRNLSVTNGAGSPNSNGVLPTTVAARVYDAAGNPSVVNSGTGAGFSNIPPASINVSNPTNFLAAPAGQNAGATMTAFLETNAAANVSNCPAAGCTGGVAAANATTVTQFTATVTGNEGANFQFTNPFSQVQFYYQDAVTGEWILIGSAIAPVVTDDATATHRTFTYTLNTTFDPPASLGTGTLKVVAVGVNASGDALASPVNTAIALTNP
jgi:hypothetical protein